MHQSSLRGARARGKASTELFCYYSPAPRSRADNEQDASIVMVVAAQHGGHAGKTSGNIDKVVYVRPGVDSRHRT